MLSWLTRVYKQREEAEKYINSPDQNQDRRATHYVAGSPHQRLDGVSALVDAGADWTLKDQTGNTPFELAAKKSHWIMTSKLAMIQWNEGDGTTASNVNFISVFKWTHFKVQNVSGKSAH